MMAPALKPSHRGVTVVPDAYYRAEAGYAPLLREAGLVDGPSVFEHPAIRVWRTITERENAVLDLPLDGATERDGGGEKRAGGGAGLRFHVKRDRRRVRQGPAAAEAAGIRTLAAAGIPTTPLAAYGRLSDGRTFVITADLTGYDDAEQLVRRGMPFERLLRPTADLAARLHNGRLHHRDLYLCHFFATPSSDPSAAGDVADVRLIDAARVKRLPRWFATRWVVKDLAQFVYSARQAGVGPNQLKAWLVRYAGQRGLGAADGLFGRVFRKAGVIARHDAALRRKQPGRGVSIGGSGVG